MVCLVVSRLSVISAESDLMIFLRDIMDDIFNSLDSELDESLTYQFLFILHSIVLAILKARRPGVVSPEVVQTVVRPEERLRKLLNDTTEQEVKRKLREEKYLSKSRKVDPEKVKRFFKRHQKRKKAQEVEYEGYECTCCTAYSQVIKHKR